MMFMLFAFAGCSNPASGFHLPKTDPIQTPIPELLGALFGSGADVTQNEDNSLTIIPDDNFNGKVPVRVGIAESDYITQGDDGGYYLDLSSLDNGDEISITFLGDITYIITKNEDGSYVFTPEVNLNVIPVTAITLSLDETTLVGKNPVSVGVTIEPVDATIQTLEWESSDETVVKVENGVLTPQKSSSGKTVTITARATDGSGVEASLEITVVSNDNSLSALKVGGMDAVDTGLGFAASVGYAVTSADVSFSMEENAIAGFRKALDADYTPVSGSSFTIANLEVGDNVFGIVITAENGDIGNYLLTITREAADIVLVNGLSLTPASLTLTAGESSGTITAEVKPENATNQSTVWISSNPDIARVEGSGTIVSVIPVSRGIAEITAKATDSGGIGSNTVTVIVQSGDTGISGLMVNNAAVSGTSPYSCDVGTAASAVIAFTLPAGASAWWSVEGESGQRQTEGMFTVDNLALGNNTIVITVNAENGETKDYTLIITKEAILVSGIELTPNQLVLIEGARGEFTVTISPADPTKAVLAWSSDNLSVATVDAVTGEIRAVAHGSATITASATDGSGVSANAKVTVQAADASLTALTVGVTSAQGTSPSFTALVENGADSVNVAFTKSQWASAEYTFEDTVTPIADSEFTVSNLKWGDNTITITVSAENGDTKEYTLIINRAPILITGIKLTPNALILNQGETGEFTVELSPADPTKAVLAWSSENPSIADVDAVTGVITAVSSGTTVIKASATDGSGISSSAELTVRDQSDQGISLGWTDGPVALKADYGADSPLSQNTTPNNELAIAIMQGQSVTLTVLDNCDNYEWSIGGAVKSNEPSYQFTGTTAGTYKILLWVNGHSKGATVIVTVKESGTVNVSLN